MIASFETQLSYDAVVVGARSVVEGSSHALAGYQSRREELSLGLFGLTDDIASFEWDLERVKTLHLALSKEMNREVDAQLQLDREFSPEMERRTA